jgi:hypothetical protein
MSFNDSKPRKNCFRAGILFQENRLPFVLSTHEQNWPQETDLEDDMTYPLQVSPRRQVLNLDQYPRTHDRTINDTFFYGVVSGVMKASSSFLK